MDDYALLRNYTQIIMPLVQLIVLEQHSSDVVAMDKLDHPLTTV